MVALRDDLENIWDEMSIVDGFSVCDREQVVVDLFSSGVGRDAAIKFWRHPDWGLEVFSLNIPLPSI